jgi:O-succinylbenzoate synthase
MLESGIGRAANVHLSTLPNFKLPGDIAASKRYFDPDLIDPPIDVAADGTIAVPKHPGIGVTIREDRVEAATLRRLVVGADLGVPPSRGYGEACQSAKRDGGGSGGHTGPPLPEAVG